MESLVRRHSPPNRVRHPADCQFASGCSPPRFAATQFPSAMGLWLTPARTSTMPITRLHGRTIPAFAGMTGVSKLIVPDQLASEFIQDSRMAYDNEPIHRNWGTPCQVFGMPAFVVRPSNLPKHPSIGHHEKACRESRMNIAFYSSPLWARGARRFNRRLLNTGGSDLHTPFTSALNTIPDSRSSRSACIHR